MNRQEPILLLTTGGTIDKTYFDELSTYQIGESQIDRLLKIAKVTYPYVTQELMRKDSLELNDEDRALLATTVREADTSRIIITHGTDTMTRTAARLTPIPNKTIVLVGALSPARFTDSDAAFNLGMAFASAQMMPAGVYITMNGTVFSADRVVKDRQKNRFVPI